MDKNTKIGYFLLSVLLVGYLFFSKNYAEKREAEQEAVQSTEQQVESVQQPQLSDVEQLDTTQQTIADSTAMAQAIQEQTVVLENDQLALTFSNKGGRIIKAALKEYESYGTHYDDDDSDFQPVVLYDKDHSTFNWITESQQTQNLIFEVSESDNKLVFTNGDIVQEYSFNDSNPYLIDYNVNLSGNSAELEWNTSFALQEKDMRNEREFTFIAYKIANGRLRKFKSMKEEAAKLVPDNLSYIVQRQRFFNQTLLTDGSFSDTQFKSSFDADSATEIKTLKTTTDVELTNGKSSMQILISPNERDILTSVDKSLSNIQPKGVFGLTKALAWLFDLIRPLFSNYGFLILSMTLLIKLILTPLTYRSYLSQAKMGVLKPEIAEINQQYKDDPTKKQQETMKLYNKAGVNPMGGCIPSLLQIPIFFSLYYFFRSSIFFRQKEFLWANDLSTYDEVIKLPFNIPILGDHISLFAVLYGVALFFSMRMTTSMGMGAMPTAPTGDDEKGGMQSMMQSQMKIMQYAMPIFLPFIFNSFPAALTFYYFCYNIINALQTWIIKKFIINEDKIHAEIQENKKKPKKTSGFRARLEEAMRAQQEIQAKSKPKK